MENKELPVILSILSLILFASVLLNLHAFQLIDNSVNSLFSSYQNNTLVSMSRAIGWIFEPKIVIIYALIISLMLFIKKYKRESLIFAASMLVSGLLIYIIKELVQRARPENMLISEASFSFPSGHALASIVFFGFLMYLALKNIKSKPLKTTLSVILIAIILTIGKSRLILNAHWLSDVLGGWFLGASILLASISIEKK